MVSVRSVTSKTWKALWAMTAGLGLLLAVVLAALADISMPSPALALGAVTPLDPWPATPQMTGTTGNPADYDFAISDGIDRLLVVLVCGYDSGGSNGQTFSAGYGGKTLTQAFLQNTNRRQTWIGYLKEADISARAGDTVTVTVTGTHTEVRAYIAGYSGVDQTLPVNASGGTYVFNTNGVTIGGPLAVNAGGYGIYGWCCSAIRIRTSDSEGYTELSDVDNAQDPNYGMAAKAFATTGSTNPVVTWSGANYASVSFITLNPATSYPSPTTTGITPDTKTIGDGAFTLTVDGANFISGLSVVRLDGEDRMTTFVSSTRLTATIPASDLMTAGTRSVTVFTPGPGGGTSNAQTLTVNKVVPTITWANPPDIVYGTPLSNTQLCATASVPGTFLYTPGVGAVLSAGDGQTLHVDFTPTDSVNYASASRDVTINVSKAALTITANDAEKTYGDSAAFTGAEFIVDGLVNGDAVTGVTLTSAGAVADATVAGSPYAIVPSSAKGAGLTNYDISYVNGYLTVNPRALTITANSFNKAFGTAVAFAGVELAADGLVNGDVVNGVTLTCVGAAIGAPVDGSPYAIVPSAAVGTGLSNYIITYVNGLLTVNKATIELSIVSSANTSSKGRSVTFTATVTDPRATGTVTLLDGEAILGSITLVDGSGTCTVSGLAVGGHSITAVYSGDGNFAGSTSSAVDLTITGAAGFNRALVGWIVAAIALALFFLIVFLIRRRRHMRRTTTISRAMRVVFNDTVPGKVSLSTVEEVSSYPIQLERELENSIKRVEKSMEGAIQAICRTVESKDPYVAAHQKRVAQFACTIAKEMGLTTWQIDGIRVAAMLHDIGKVTVPTEILTKPGHLSKIEMAMIKDHPKVAFDILKSIEFDWPVARMVVQHHERMDGSGYPDGLKGEEILLEARILAVADVVEAMCTHRPYRPARGVDGALAELERGDGTLYDSDVVRACKKVLMERGFKIELTATRS